MSLDYAVYRGDAERNFVEFYYSFGSNQLSLQRDNDQLFVAAKLHLWIRDSAADSTVVDRAWQVRHRFTDPSDLESNRGLVGVLNFWLRPGQYWVMLTGNDVYDSANQDSLELPITVRPFPTDSLTISDVELCSMIRQIQPDSGNIFYKNTLEVIPNPSALYGTGLPMVYYYVEVYNLLKKTQTGDYVIVASVHDAVGTPVLSQRRLKRRVHNSSVEVGAMNVSQLKSGTYSLKVTVNDTITGQSASSTKKFFVYNPNVVAAEQPGGGIREDYLESEYALMNEKEVEKEIEYIQYIAFGDEQAEFKRITDLVGKRRALFEFWKKRDPDPTTRINETKSEYLSRVEYANRNFRSAGKEGWRTDRGRVYIVYGPPNEYERHPSAIDTKSYEIWYYHNIQGGVEFVFVDKSNFADYILVHSTHRNELRDDNWRQQLAK